MTSDDPGNPVGTARHRSEMSLNYTLAENCDAVSQAALTRLRNRLMRHYNIVAEMRMEAWAPAQSNTRITRSLHNLKRWFEVQLLGHYFAQPPAWRKYLRGLRGNRTLPDFCIIGPPKCATSDLATSVLLHPNVIPPLAKEIHSPDAESWRLYYPTERERARHTKRFGLALSPYLHPSLHRMEVPYSLRYSRPDAKIVIVLRNPIERLYSHWKWELFLSGSIRAKKLPFLATFGQYVDKSLGMHEEGLMYSACDAEGLTHSIYGNAVRNWIDCFGRNNVLVLNVEDYFSDQAAFMDEVYSFVGLPKMNLPKFESRTNENPLRTPPPEDETIEKLRNFFAPHNENLWKIIDKKFDW